MRKNPEAIFIVDIPNVSATKVSTIKKRKLDYQMTFKETYFIFISVDSTNLTRKNIEFYKINV